MTINDVKLFLLDMDGTFYLGGQLIEGSLDFIKKVQESGRDFMFLTNNSSHNANFYVQKLAKMGLNIDRSKVMTSGEATCEKINELYPGKRCFVLGNEFLLEEFAEAGIPVDNENPEIVVIGFDTTLDYQKMWDVCNFVRAGLPYIATHPDFNCPTETGFIPDSGAIAAFVTASTGKTPTYFGKPYAETVEMISEATGFSREEMCIFGDRLYTDIALGKKHGVTAVLVLSGETQPADVDAATPAEKPDYVFPSLDEVDHAMFG